VSAFRPLLLSGFGAAIGGQLQEVRHHILFVFAGVGEIIQVLPEVGPRVGGAGEFVTEIRRLRRREFSSPIEQIDHRLHHRPEARFGHGIVAPVLEQIDVGSNAVLEQ
jgi:hypothetical protein